MEAANPDWEEWVEELTTSEQRVATELLEEYLQRIQGRDRAALQKLGCTLGIDEEAQHKLHNGNRFERFWALRWILRLDINIKIEVLQNTSKDYPETRAAAARVLYEQEQPDAAQAGTELLLQGSEPLSVLGIDTLYQLNKLSPEPLITSAKGSYDNWTESRLIQVLQVIGEAGPSKPDATLGWIGFLFLSESPNVRAAAARSLSGYGWHEDVRSAVDIEQIRADESPKVRRAVYRMLGTWDDKESTDRLISAIKTEASPRAAIDAIVALEGQVAQVPESDLSTASAAAEDWVLRSKYGDKEAAQ
jgi:hypothetical protein